MLAVVLLYAMFAGLWILLSDRVVTWAFEDPAQIALASTLKGWFFVAVTSLLLYGLMRRLLGVAAMEAAPSPGRLPLLPFALLAALIVAVIALAIAQGFHHQRYEEIARLQAVADLKVRQISDWLQERQGDAEFIQSSGFFADQYRHWRESGDMIAAERLQTRLQQFAQSRGVVAVTLLDPRGVQLWATGEAPRDLAPALQEAAVLAAHTGRVRRVGPYLGQAGHPRLDYLAPLAAGGVPSPIVVLHLSPDGWLRDALRAWPVPSDSSEALLFRREGDQVLFINELRHRASSALTLRMPLASPDLLAAKLLRNEAPQGDAVDGRDYRQVPVLGVMRAVPGTDWYLVAKINQAEVYGKAVKEAVGIGLAGLFALFLAGAGVVLLRQRQQLAFADGIRETQADLLRVLNLLEAVADGSADAIFAKDLEGRYILFNRAASEFVGKPVAEVLGRDDRAIFPPEQAELLMAAGRQVIAEGRGVTREEVLSTSGGERTFIATKAPLRDGNGRVIGIFGISRDITQQKRTEATLRREWGLRQRYLDTLQAIMVALDIEGRITMINRAGCQLLGRSEEQLLGRNWFDVCLPQTEVKTRMFEVFCQILAGRLEDFEYQEHPVICADGSERLIAWHNNHLTDDTGQVIGTLSAGEDITNRLAAEDSLRESEQRFHDIVNASADWIWEIDAAARYTYASDSVADLLGYTPAEILGKTPFDLMPAEEAARVQPLFARIAERREPFRDLDNISRHKDGSLRHVQTNGMPIFDAQGRLAGYRGLDRDVSERKRAELALLETSKRLSTLVHTIPDLIWLKDPQGVYLSCNPRFEELFGAREAEIVGKTDYDFVDRQLADFFRKKDQAAIAVGGPSMNEEEVTFASDGHREILQTIKTPIHGNGGELIGVLGIARDITAIKAAEAALMRQTEELRARNEELERFNRAVVGRELDMIDLKRQINELCRQLGQQPVYNLDFAAAPPSSAAGDRP